VDVSPKQRRCLLTSTAPRPVSSRGFNRQSVQEAIRSLKSKLALFKSTPPNGLALFCGQCENSEGAQKLVVAIEPPQPLQHSMYKCDKNFHTGMLKEQLSDSSTFGFIIIDGSGVSFYTLKGSVRRLLMKWGVCLPNKQGRGGQSKNRFERIRMEKRGWYVSKVQENAVQLFIDPGTSRPNVEAIIIGGSADLKNELAKKLDPRLVRVVAAVVDIQYNGDIGLNEAIHQTSDILSDLKVVKEQAVLNKLFDRISQDGQYTIGIEDSIYALESGSLETLIVWDGIPYERHTCVSTQDGKKKVIFTNPNDKERTSLGDEWKVESTEPLLDWILDHYHEFGSVLEVVSSSCSVGNQFVKGFGGIGGILRYELDLPSNHDENPVDEEEEEYEW